MTGADADAAAARLNLDGVLMALRDARRHLEAGVLVDLVGMDARVQDACAALASLDPAVAREFLDDLTSVAAELAAIEAECARRREALDTVQDGGQADRIRAAQAYSRIRDEAP